MSMLANKGDKNVVLMATVLLQCYRSGRYTGNIIAPQYKHNTAEIVFQFVVDDIIPLSILSFISRQPHGIKMGQFPN